MRARTRSNRRLLLVLALAVLPPLVLVLGPYRERFFPSGVHELRALARVVPPPLDRAAIVKLAGADDVLVDELERDMQAANWEAMRERLGALPRERVAPGLMWLHGVAALLARRPALAIAGLEGAIESQDPELASDARFQLAQAFLMLNRRDEAAALLKVVASEPGPHATTAREQAAELAALR